MSLIKSSLPKSANDPAPVKRNATQTSGATDAPTFHPEELNINTPVNNTSVNNAELRTADNLPLSRGVPISTAGTTWTRCVRLPCFRASLCTPRFLRSHSVDREDSQQSGLYDGLFACVVASCLAKARGCVTSRNLRTDCTLSTRHFVILAQWIVRDLQFSADRRDRRTDLRHRVRLLLRFRRPCFQLHRRTRQRRSRLTS
jgi:hypothetical protein